MPFAPITSRPALDDHAAGRRQVAWAIAASLAFVLAVGLFLLARRMAGALTVPLAPAPLVATALVLLLWAASVRALWMRWQGPNRVPDHPVTGELRSPDTAARRTSRLPERVLATWLPTAVLLLFAIGCSYPGNRIVDWLVWLPAIAGDWWLRGALFPAKRSSPPIGVRSPSVQGDSVDEQLLQQITRTRTADGREVIHGTLVAELAAGEQSATLYVAFCPPFERLPQVEAEATDCPDASVKLIQALHHGAQLEVCLFEVFEIAQHVTVELLATAGADE